MPLVVDASVTLAWYFPDEQTPKALEAREALARDGGLVPPHWWYEVRNGMIMAERHGRTTEQLIAPALLNLARLPIDQISRQDDTDIFPIARRHRLTFYDAAYLALAQREQIGLATLDAELAHAAAAEGVSLIIPL